ncbi:restriction endonuclease subunit S [Staphylococcus epidermidis]|jgi:type I restriction-modification system specificty subunit|uniref:restriction endonuclease subunit S n=1 Tax=Staphylococcus epidermidis TaxID=1282 RepID=UPI000C311777|nr:restriction endonuclease subunit S [Staphylococcus epidermidis]HEH2286463.1 restriction endonuclease subunit S [Staphylococcus aureus]MBM5955265.1 restriction endonuclease subunit S [Staphylococcus epidermidis]MCG1095817.1 restriction endonuclease subunit S [Staphylococcus epidermidis]MCG1735853.1 restriction endonuclease subunit S [Staphylococcus epidermidis]MCG1877161.1 restriction endonuclease subunit S [Staphylococcus epidermidis]
MINKMKTVPELRFSNFCDEWINYKLGEIVDIRGRIGFRGYTKSDIIDKENGGILTFSPTNIISNKLKNTAHDTYITKEKYEESPEIMVKNGDILFVKTGSTLGKSTLVANLNEEATVNPQIVVMKVKDFFHQKFTSTYVTLNKILRQVAQIRIGGAIPTLTESEIKKIQVNFPVYEEQEKIGTFFSKLDRQIELEEKKLELLEQQKRGYIQQLYSQEIRFKDDKGENYPEWKLTELNAIFTKYKNTIYLKDEQEYKRISISNRGIISHRDITLGKEIGRKRQYVIDLNNHPNTLTFIRQGVFLGGIGFVPKFLNNYIVTENMPLLSMDSKYNKLFMTYLFESEDYYKNVIFKNLPIGSAQKALHEKEWLQSTVSVPILEEQEKIGNFFNKTDNLIELQTKKIESLKQRKRGLLQKMFV